MATSAYTLTGSEFPPRPRTLLGPAVAAQAPFDDMCEFARVLQDTAERYQGLATILSAAHVRVLAGMSRHLVAIGEA